LVLDGRHILSNVTASSLKLHQRYKGIIPEIASRAHIESISLVLAQALSAAKKGAPDIDVICVTKEPGLIGSLFVGVSFAKALSLSLNKPLVGVDHLEAHLYANFLSFEKEHRDIPEAPFIGLVVSGGHTSLFYVHKDFSFKPMSATLDDAAGEAFDKVAKILDLGYPGGPVIEELAKKGNPLAAGLSCLGGEDLNFSFSGIKTAVLYKVTRSQERKSTRKDMAAGFQEAVVKVLVDKSLQACRQKRLKSLVIGGGVAANNYFRLRMEEEAKKAGVRVWFPAKGLNLDNAAMVAGLGYQLFRKGQRDNYYLTPA
jgi:N6-L-threonylcarbamoyladenine synthase